jgi:5-formyltetrahydrofolate cyclo-ligase
MGASKSDLRRQALARRDLVSPHEAHAAAKAMCALGLHFAKAHCNPPDVVALYWPIRSEIGTRPLFEALVASGFRTALPVVGADRLLDFRLWAPGEDLEHGSFGLSHPPSVAPLATPDLVFVPLAAFDARGGRLGYGRGYYDATLEKRRREGPVIVAGLAYTIQEIDTVPAEGHDQPLDFVITEERIVTCGAG